MHMHLICSLLVSVDLGLASAQTIRDKRFQWNEGDDAMTLRRTRLSLYYLATYLLIGGLGLLLVPESTLRLLGSIGNYGDVFPRVAGLLLLGIGLSIVSMIRLRQAQSYPGTLG